MKLKVAAAMLTIGALLQGCAMYTKPDVPPVESPENFKISFDAPLGNLNFSWWENFNDPILNDLVEEAIASNYNYLATLKNIDIAQTYVSQSMSALLPFVTVDMQNTRNNNIVDVQGAVSAAPDVNTANGPFNLQLLSATATYEVHVWNQVRNTINQAEADKVATEAQSNVIRLTLIASVVHSYYQIMALNDNIDDLLLQKEAATEILSLRKIQYESGLINNTAVLSASDTLEEITSTLTLARKQKAIMENTLAYLMGDYPENFSVRPKGRITHIKIKELIPEGVPSLVVALRPDIQSAFQQVLSYGYLEKQNIANFLPTFSLTGTYGYANSSMAGLIKSGNAIWSYGLSTIEVLFNYPALYSQYKRSRIQYESAVLLYQDAVVNAFKEVDSALASYEQDAIGLESYHQQKMNANESLSIALAQYQAGLIDYTVYLDSEFNRLQANINLTNQHFLVTDDVINAYKTMGLGLEVAPAVVMENEQTNG